MYVDQNQICWKFQKVRGWFTLSSFAVCEQNPLPSATSFASHCEVWCHLL
jgi:hypothetical protein